MNSNKFDFYKASKYFLISDAIIVLVGIAVSLIFGLNLDTSIQSAHLLFTAAVSIVISLIAILIYVGLRYDFAKAFSLIVNIVHNILMGTALLAIIRVPISESLIMSYILLIGLTSVFTLILTEKLKDIDLKKADYHLIIKDAIGNSVKQLIIVSASVVAILLLCLIFASSNMMLLIRQTLVMIFVLIYSSIFISLPLWCFFSSKIKRVKRSVIDSNVKNQKIVKAAIPLESEQAVEKIEKEDILSDHLNVE